MKQEEVLSLTRHSITAIIIFFVKSAGDETIVEGAEEINKMKQQTAL